MTYEELRDAIAKIIDDWGRDSFDFPKDPRTYADQILTLIREVEGEKNERR